MYFGLRPKLQSCGLSLTCQMKTNVSFAVACFPADFGLRPKLQSCGLSLTCQVKTNVTFAVACFPADKLHYTPYYPFSTSKAFLRF